MVKKRQYARRRAGTQPGHVHGHAALVHGGKSVHVLFRADGIDAGTGIQTFGQRKLKQNAVHGRIGIERGDELLQFLLQNGSRPAVGTRVYAGIGTGSFLVAHIHLGGRVFSHQNHSQTGGASGLFPVLCYVLTKRGANGRRGSLSVEYHGSSSFSGLAGGMS